MTEEDEQKLVIPSVVRWELSFPNEAFVYQLSQEINSERERSLSIARELEQEKRKNEELEKYLASLVNSKPGVPRVESNNSIASTAPDLNDEKPLIGAYSAEIRKQKILKYKQKMVRYRQKVRLSRKFGGRSKVAKQKLRIKGKFVKSIDNI
ncbi:unnamed protein product [Blepharisma stoltei]|uniref:CCT domain-containing protein n=1 Tax=Blepharisma stoltei TaxID=1481888 RepID=A0AAU9JZY4_9CILI|nr:unnamed protein product [Blepharisma stoltei]